jgi:hypothetical protein
MVVDASTHEHSLCLRTMERQKKADPAALKRSSFFELGRPVPDWSYDSSAPGADPGCIQIPQGNVHFSKSQSPI